MQSLKIVKRTTIGGMLSGKLRHPFRLVTNQATFLLGYKVHNWLKSKCNDNNLFRSTGKLEK